MLLYIEDKIVVFGILLFIAVLGIIGGIIYLIARSKRKSKVLKVRDKYTPMSGKDYLYIDKTTGMILKDRNGEKCMFFDSEEEAQFILDQYETEKNKPIGPG
jgi:hypothetical protein